MAKGFRVTADEWDTGQDFHEGFLLLGYRLQAGGWAREAWQGDEAWQDPGDPGGHRSQPVFCPQPTFPCLLQKGRRCRSQPLLPGPLWRDWGSPRCTGEFAVENGLQGRTLLGLSSS